MAKGAYRTYFHIGSIGIKIPRYEGYYANPMLSFMTGIIMNVLERKRYKYYVLHKEIRQWGMKWKSSHDDVRFCPCYFTCGLFSIYKHLPKECTWDDLAKEAKISDVEGFWQEKTMWVTNDIKDRNFRKDKQGKIYCVDYGDFVINTVRHDSVINLDYK